MKMRLVIAMIVAGAISRSAFAADAPIQIWVETPGTMILHDRPAGTGKEISLNGAHNEYLSAQIALRAGGSIEKPVTFEWTGLKGPGGKEIDKANIVLYREADVVVDHGSNENKIKDSQRARPLGDYPDAMVPLYMRDGTNVANSIKLDQDQTQAFWVDIFIPAGAAPGQYTGTISLQTGGTAMKVPVNLDVLNIEIPADSTIPSIYNLRAEYKNVAANVEAYVSEIMAHRLQPTNYHYLDMRPEVRNKFNPNGKGWVSILLGDTASPTPEREKTAVATLNGIEADLKSRKLFEHTYLQLKDEPKMDSLPGMIDFAKMIVKDCPDWKGHLIDTLSIKEGTELDDLLTADVKPLRLYGAWSYKAYDGRAEWDARRAKGQQLWFYVSNNQGTPYPTFDVNTPNVAFEPRVMAWAWWYEKAVGHLYWDLLFNETWQLNKRFPPGDGQLLYPGDFTLPGAPSWVLVKDLHAPVISRRMKVFRQGLQEWELLKMVETKVGRAKVEPIVSAIYTCMGKSGEGANAYDPAHPMWSYSEGDWDKARSEVLQLLDPHAPAARETK